MIIYEVLGVEFKVQYLQHLYEMTLNLTCIGSPGNHTFNQNQVVYCAIYFWKTREVKHETKFMVQILVGNYFLQPPASLQGIL